MNSILFVRLSAMGDLVQCLGAIEALAAVRPEVRSTVVTQASLTPLLSGFPGVSRVIGFRRDAGWRGLRQVRRELHEDCYDLALDLQGNWKSAMITRMSGARERVGARGAGRKEPWSAVLLDRTVPIVGDPHPARVALQLVRAIEPAAPARLPRLVATEAEVVAERTAIRSAGVDPTRPFQVIVVTDPADPRALRERVILAVAKAAPMPVLLVLGPAEVAVPVSPEFAQLRHGRNEVRRLVALGSVVAAASGRVLGPDQGGVHVLAAAGAACTVMFGAQDPARTAPPAAAAVVHPEPPACSPCGKRRCRHPKGVVCMEFDPAAGRVVQACRPFR